MARKPRVVVPGGAYHVFTRGNNRQSIAVDEHDFRTFEAMARRTFERHRWICWAYCIMPNHVHFVLETTGPTLSRGMQQLLSRYAQAFNERHGRSGHVFQGRFNDRLLEGPEAIAAACAYVFANPVAAGLCSSCEEWPFSGGLAATWRSDAGTPHAA